MKIFSYVSSRTFIVPFTQRSPINLKLIISVRCEVRGNVNFFHMDIPLL